jgi:hypothetical protein
VGQPVFDSAPLFFPHTATAVEVYAPTGTTITVIGFRRA